jgi:hypothetical protein
VAAGAVTAVGDVVDVGTKKRSRGRKRARVVIQEGRLTGFCALCYGIIEPSRKIVNGPFASNCPLQLRIMVFVAFALCFRFRICLLRWCRLGRPVPWVPRLLWVILVLKVTPVMSVFLFQRTFSCRFGLVRGPSELEPA